MKIEVCRLDPSRHVDFYRVHSEENGAGWCFCVAWWTPTWDGWGERTADENQRLREDLFADGHDDGYLLYVDGDPVGWCQCGVRDRLTKLTNRFKLDPDPSAWAITCFHIKPSLHGQGLAHRFLAGVLDDLKRRGAAWVQAFPRRGERLPVDDVWTGPEALFRGAGFQLEEDDGKYPIYKLILDSSGG